METKIMNSIPKTLDAMKKAFADKEVGTILSEDTTISLEMVVSPEVFELLTSPTDITNNVKGHAPASSGKAQTSETATKPPATPDGGAEAGCCVPSC